VAANVVLNSPAGKLTVLPIPQLDLRDHFAAEKREGRREGK